MLVGLVLIARRSLVKTVETLNACMPAHAPTKGSIRFRRILGIARDVFNRGDLLDSVKQCRVDMQTTLDLFNVRLLSCVFRFHLTDMTLRTD